MRKRASLGAVVFLALVTMTVSSCSHSPTEQDATLATLTDSFPQSMQRGGSYTVSIQLVGEPTLKGVSDSTLTLAVGSAFQKFGVLSSNADYVQPTYDQNPIRPLTPPTPVMTLRRYSFGASTQVTAIARLDVSPYAALGSYEIPIWLEVGRPVTATQRWTVRTQILPE